MRFSASRPIEGSGAVGHMDIVNIPLTHDV